MEVTGLESDVDVCAMPRITRTCVSGFFLTVFELMGEAFIATLVPCNPLKALFQQSLLRFIQIMGIYAQDGRSHVEQVDT